MASLFLSYRRADSQEVVGRICDRLKLHFPVQQIFRDLDSIPLGKPFPDVIRDAVVRSNIVLIVIGPSWTSITDAEGIRRLQDPGDLVRIEVELALSSGVRVVPILVSGATMPHPHELPTSLQSLVVLQAIQVRPDPDFDRDMDRLLGNLATSITDTESAPSSNQIGRYKIEGDVAAGARARVVRAWDTLLNRPVMLKMAQDTNQAADFIREAQIAAQFRHPSLVAWYDVGCDDNGRVFAVQEYVEGSTLAKLYRSRTFSLTDRVNVLIEVAEALHHGHLTGHLHLDLNLDNILVDGAGRAHVLDFGALRPRPGSIVGRLAYIAPETMKGENDFKDGRTDVWNLGIVMYQVFTGRLPFEGNLGELSESIVTEDPPPPASIDSTVPPVLNGICMKCLSKAKDGRYQSAKALADDLKSWLREHG